VVHDLGTLHRPDDYKKSHVTFYRLYMQRMLKKARVVATVSEFSKADILSDYKLPASKIEVVYSAVKESFHPLTAEEQEAVRQQYTGGSAYFIYVGAVHPRKNLVNLLKAFSVFKKRLQSNMKLVLAGRLAWKNDEFLQLLQNYKYRDEVILTNYIEESEIVRLLGASYALVYPSLFEGFGVPVLEAMKCDVPALTSQNTSMQEIAGEAGLYFDPASYQDIAEQMMRIYKDEDLRKRLIEKGRETAAAFSWERTAALLWTGVERCLKKE
jgi:glycosyltransferase involved in cell wall biosynthesis